MKWVVLQCVIVVFHDHTHFLEDIKQTTKDALPKRSLLIDLANRSRSKQCIKV